MTKTLTNANNMFWGGWKRGWGRMVLHHQNIPKCISTFYFILTCWNVKINMMFVFSTCLPSFWWLNESSVFIIKRYIGWDIGQWKKVQNTDIRQKWRRKLMPWIKKWSSIHLKLSTLMGSFGFIFHNYISSRVLYAFM